MSDSQEDLYQCVGVCMADPDSGYCLGCGRPPMDSPVIVAEVVIAIDANILDACASPTVTSRLQISRLRT